MRFLGFALPAFIAATLSLGGCVLFATEPLDAGPSPSPDAGRPAGLDGGDRNLDAGNDLDAGGLGLDAGRLDAGGGDAGAIDAGDRGGPDGAGAAGPNDAVLADGGPPECGNNEIETGEDCDDGNLVDDDDCTNGCTLNGRCGDGVVQAGIEDCDDENLSEGDYCSNACLEIGFCGDGTLQPDLEECDPDAGPAMSECTTQCRAWWNTEFSVRLPVTIVNGTGTELSDVPVAVSIPTSAQPEFFVSRSGVCVLAGDHQRRLIADFEAVNPPNDAPAVLWIRVPTLPPGETQVFLYGNPSGGGAACPQLAGSVFNPVYSGVWHMESTSPRDTSGNGLNATPFGNPSETVGVLGRAVGTGYGDHIRVDNAGDSLGYFGDLSVEAWVRMDDFAASTDRSAIFQLSPHQLQNPEVFQMNLMHDGHMRVSWQPSHTPGDPGPYPAGNGPNPNESIGFTLAVGQWHHYAWVKNSTDKTVRFFRDGTQLGAPLGYAEDPVDTTSNSRFRMGGAHSDLWSLGGAIDEVRITNQALAPEWIRFQVDMMSDAVPTVGEPQLLSSLQ